MHASRAASQAHLLVRCNDTSDPVPSGWEAHSVTLEELALAYLREPGATAFPGPRPVPERRTVGGDELTALTVPAVQRKDANLRPVPWRRMAWVTWRQHRFALIGVAALWGRWRCGSWIVGLQLHHAYAAAIACHPASSIACSDLVSRFNGMDNVLSNGFVLQPVPALIGAFVGAPVLARELETGTFRFAWTQGFGRWRWTLAKLVALAVVVTAAGGALSVLISWYYRPYFQTRQPSPGPLTRCPRSTPDCSTCGGLDSRPGRWPPSLSAAWPACSFAGSSRPSSPPWPPTPGLAFATGLYLRQHYLTPLVSDSPNNGCGPAQRGSSASSGLPREAGRSASPCSAKFFREHHHRLAGKGAGSREPSARRSTSCSTATCRGPATSRPAGSGRSSSWKRDGSLRSPSSWSPPRPGSCVDDPPEHRPPNHYANPETLWTTPRKRPFASRRAVGARRVADGRDPRCFASRLRPAAAAHRPQAWPRARPPPPLPAIRTVAPPKERGS